MRFTFLPFLYLGFGLKGVITDNIHLMVEGAILDGSVLRGGLAPAVLNNKSVLRIWASLTIAFLGFVKRSRPASAEEGLSFSPS